MRNEKAHIRNHLPLPVACTASERLSGRFYALTRKRTRLTPSKPLKIVLIRFTNVNDYAPE
jgi:hypothetical protein